MTDPLLWLIYPTYYLNIKCMLLASRRRFHVNVGFSDADRILIKKNLYKI